MTEPTGGRPHPALLATRLPAIVVCLWAIVCGALVLRAWLALDEPCDHDDAFMAFRYAKNLALGNGLVFNVGERVWGFTSPLVVLVLAALNALGASLERASIVMGVAASSLNAILLWRLLSPFISPFLAVAMSLFCITALTSFRYLGLETQELLVLQTLFLTLLVCRRMALAALIGGLACLTRPDSVVLVAMMFLLTKELRRLRPVLFLSVPGLAWLLFARLYYGDWLPQTFYAKSGATSFVSAMARNIHLLNTFPFADYSFKLDEFSPSLVVAALINVGVTAITLFQRRLRVEKTIVAAFLLYPWVLCLSYAIIGPPGGQDWEVHSAVFFNQMALALGLLTAAERLADLARQRTVVWVLHLSLLVGTALLSLKNLDIHRGTPAWSVTAYWAGARHRSYLEVAKWINANLPAGTVMSMDEPGTVGFYTQLYVIDLYHIVIRKEPKEAPPYRLEFGDSLRSEVGLVRYERLQFFPARGFRDLSLMKRVGE